MRARVKWGYQGENRMGKRFPSIEDGWITVATFRPLIQEPSNLDSKPVGSTIRARLLWGRLFYVLDLSTCSENTWTTEMYRKCTICWVANRRRLGSCRACNGQSLRAPFCFILREEDRWQLWIMFGREKDWYALLFLGNDRYAPLC